MNILNTPICKNCGRPVNVIIVNDDNDNVLVFCSDKCFAEYRLCDGGDDGFYEFPVGKLCFAARKFMQKL